MQHATGTTQHAAPEAGFRALRAWKAANELASQVYRELKGLAGADAWLKSQVIRAAISVPANIAEGHGRGSFRDYLRFLDIARGSLAELEYSLLFLEQESLLKPDRARHLETHRIAAGNLLHGLWRSMKAKSAEDWDHSGRISEERGLYSFDDDLE